MDRAVALRQVLTDLPTFSRALFPGFELRRYQAEALAPIVDTLQRHQGGTYVLLFPRQAGKDEALAQLLAWLLATWQRRTRSSVFVTPTFQQSDINRRRLLAHVTGDRARAVLRLARPAAGFRVVCGGAQVVYRSAQKEANARGETASGVLIGNEAQNITPAIWDARFSPMTASTDAPSVIAGTPWESSSLLAREIASAEGTGRLMRVAWEQVADELPAYGRHVRQRRAQLGEGHPFFRTEYLLESLDGAGGLFAEQRQAHMHGTHARQASRQGDELIALCLDVAGGDEEQSADPASRSREKLPDSTALTVYAVDLATVADPLIQRPTYRVLDRQEWIGVSHPALYGTLLDLVRNIWGAAWLIGDATGIGAGLMQFLDRALAGSHCKVIPFVFSSTSKSNLGWGFIGVIESGRWKDYADDGASITRRFWQQVGDCTFEVVTGPGRLLRWSVPEAKGNDDLLSSASLIASLDQAEQWTAASSTTRTTYRSRRQ